MFRFAIDKPVIVTVVVLILCLFGILSIYRVPIQMIPDLDVLSPSQDVSSLAHHRAGERSLHRQNSDDHYSVW